MIINHNVPALNTHRQLSINTANTNKNIEKLSSGLRINRAGDDAAGLAISEKMRGQIRGLDQASRNAQDGISLIQTAEGALNETHSILQRQREIANQSANGTNTDSDRQALQDEMNALTSEINRIGNTTEFNTQKLLQGDGKSNLAASGLVPTAVSQTGVNAVHTQATADITVNATAVAGDDIKITLNGVDLTASFKANVNTKADSEATVTGAGTADINIAGTANANNSADGLANAFQAMIDNNEMLKGNYTAVSDGAGKVTISAVAGGKFEGAAGNISGYDESGATGASFTETVTGAVGKTAAATAATTNLDFSASGLNIDSKAKVEALVGKGFTINDQQVEFYDANKGTYTGKGIGVNISDAINATANFDDVLANIVSTQLNGKVEGIKAAATGAATGIIKIDSATAGATYKLEIKDGGVQKAFETSFQIGANTGQSMSLSINDMRSKALGITGKAGDAGFTAANTVTDGTNDVKGEAALNIATKEGAAAAIAILDKATATVSSERSKLGATQNRLEHTINNLGTASENLTAAESRIRDVDMAKEMMQQTKNNILAQAAQAMLAQANQQPQGVLQLLR
ncbi:flagellin [Paenibacillus sp. FSL K6-1217]|uniref:flagellin N-terminal helical domain-containing protein n=1 Tax=Paenibacillus sp. FSL K6-1217 TaxID=2921466 RepID=UPI00324A2487